MKGALAFIGIMFVATRDPGPGAGAVRAADSLLDLLVIILVTLAIAALVVVGDAPAAARRVGVAAVLPVRSSSPWALRGLSIATKVYFAGKLDKVDDALRRVGGRDRDPPVPLPRGAVLRLGPVPERPDRWRRRRPAREPASRPEGPPVTTAGDPVGPRDQPPVD